MGMKEYETVVNGFPTTVVLDDEQAEAQGLKGGKAYEETKAASEDGPTVVGDKPDTKKADEPENKSRSASTKKS